MGVPIWKTVLVAMINAGVAVLLEHFAGTGAAAAGVAGVTAVAHFMKSPLEQKKPE